MGFTFADITNISHKDRWHNTQRTILTSKLDLLQPSWVRDTWLRSCQTSVTFACPFQICAAAEGWAFFWGGGRVLMTRSLNPEAGLGSGESKVISLNWLSMISSNMNPLHLIGGHNPQLPRSSSHQQVTGPYSNFTFRIRQSNLKCSSAHDSQTKWDLINVFIDWLRLTSESAGAYSPQTPQLDSAYS